MVMLRIHVMCDAIYYGLLEEKCVRIFPLSKNTQTHVKYIREVTHVAFHSDASG